MPHPAVAGVVLAAGLSSRFERGNKLYEQLDGRSVLRRTVEAYCDALSTVFVVAADDDARVHWDLEHLPVVLVANSAYRSGQASSLRRGIRALPSSAEGAVIGPGDMPLLDAATIRSLVQAFANRSAPIVAPYYEASRGSPILFSRTVFPELMGVSGDVGGRAVLRGHLVEKVSIARWWTGLDVDTVADLEHANEYLSHPPSISQATVAPGDT